MLRSCIFRNIYKTTKNIHSQNTLTEKCATKDMHQSRDTCASDAQMHTRMGHSSAMRNKLYAPIRNYSILSSRHMHSCQRLEQEGGVAGGGSGGGCRLMCCDWIMIDKSVLPYSVWISANSQQSELSIISILEGKWWMAVKSRYASWFRFLLNCC